MAVRAKDAVDAALILMGHVNELGAVDESREARYFGAAPAYLNILCGEIAGAEGNNTPVNPINDLEQELDIGEDAAKRVLPPGLAMYFAVLDRDSALYGFFSQLYYQKMLPSLKTGEAVIEDSYGVLKDGTFQ